METFSQSFPSQPLDCPHAKPWAIAGVVGSGNMEVLFERNSGNPDRMECSVESSIPGYKDSWLAALGDFAGHYAAGGLKVTIHDQGAAPIVVTFRLRQAYDHLTKKSP